MKHIHSKQEFYALSRALLLGNRLNQWDWPTFDRMFHSGVALPKLIGVRTVNRVSNKTTHLYTPYQAHKYGHEQYGKDVLLFDEALLPSLITVQGELIPDVEDLYLRYTYHPAHMRLAFEADVNGPRPVFKHAFGLEAWGVLKRFMDPPSLEMLHQILHDYHYPVVEFSCAKKSVGVFRWNTIFWEVRTTY